MANVQNNTIKNRLLKEIPGENITWRHMQSDDSNSLYSRDGVRYFAIKLDDEFAEELEAEGWPVIWRNVNRNENEPEIMQAFIKVFIKYGTRFPCDIYLMNAINKTKTLLKEEDLDNLRIDTKTIDYISVMIRPYFWTYGDKHGVKAQVQAMNIMLAQDGLDDDYEVV